jgi:hypothetical protein
VEAGGSAHDELDGENLLRVTQVDDLCQADGGAELGDVLDDARRRIEQGRRARDR